MHYGSPAQRILIFLFTLRAAPHTHWHKINNTKPKFLLFPSTCWPLFRFGLNVSAACHAMKELSGPMLCVATQKLKFAGAHIFHHHHFDSPPSWSSTGASREASSISCCCHATFSAILQSSAPPLLRSLVPVKRDNPHIDHHHRHRDRWEAKGTRLETTPDQMIMIDANVGNRNASEQSRRSWPEGKTASAFDLFAAPAATGH